MGFEAIFFKELISNLNEIRGWSQRVLYGIIIDKITRMKERGYLQ